MSNESTEHVDNVLYVEYKERTALYSCYMQFCKDGGLFVPGASKFHLGSLVCLIVQLPDSGERFTVSGRVAAMRFGKNRGAGVRFASDEWARALKVKIENVLAGSVKSANPTWTM